MKVNKELMELYRNIGEDIVIRGISGMAQNHKSNKSDGSSVYVNSEIDSIAEALEKDSNNIPSVSVSSAPEIASPVSATAMDGSSLSMADWEYDLDSFFPWRTGRRQWCRETA